MAAGEFHRFREIVAQLVDDHIEDKQHMVTKIGEEIDGELASDVARLAKTTDEGLQCPETCHGGVGGALKAQARSTEYHEVPKDYRVR